MQLEKNFYFFISQIELVQRMRNKRKGNENETMKKKKNNNK